MTASMTKLMTASMTSLKWKPFGTNATSLMHSIMNIFHGKIQSNHIITRLLPHPMQAIREKLCQPNLFVLSARYPLTDTSTLFTLYVLFSLPRTLTDSLTSAVSNNSLVTNQNSDKILENSIYLSSTMKKRRTKMNKHKLKKRRKLLKMNTKASREA